LADVSHSPCSVCAILNLTHSAVTCYEAEHTTLSVSVCTPVSYLQASTVQPITLSLCQLNNLQRGSTPNSSSLHVAGSNQLLGKTQAGYQIFHVITKGNGRWATAESRA